MLRSLTALALIAMPLAGHAQSIEALLPKLEELAAQSNAEATYHLGMAYQTGSGAPLDHHKALKYFRKAAAEGDPLAAYKLGCFYAGQDGVLAPDADAALRYKLTAARAGYALAQGDGAGLYAERGQIDEARAWSAKAVDQGTADALFGYAALHNEKNGLPEDPVVVVAYFTLYLGRIDASAEQSQWLADEKAALAPSERAHADAIIDAYRPHPTALTMKALSGQRAAQALVATDLP